MFDEPLSDTDDLTRMADTLITDLRNYEVE